MITTLKRPNPLDVALLLGTIGLLVLWVMSVRDRKLAWDAAARADSIQREAETWRKRYESAARALDVASIGVTTQIEHLKRDTVVRIVPVTHSDTVRLVQAVPQLIARTDSVVAACTELQRSCDTIRRVADSTIAAQQRGLDQLHSDLNNALRKQSPRCGTKCGFILGVAASAVTVHYLRP